MDLRIMDAIDVLMDDDRLLSVTADHGEVSLQTTGGSEVLIAELGEMLLVTKMFNIGIERATIETPVFNAAELRWSLDRLIEWERKNED